MFAPSESSVDAGDAGASPKPMLHRRSGAPAWPFEIDTLRADGAGSRASRPRPSDRERASARPLEAEPGPIALLRARDGEPIYESPAARALLHPGAHSRTPASRPSANDSQSPYRELVEQLEKTAGIGECELRLDRSDGSTLRVLASCRSVALHGEEFLLVRLVDISERIESPLRPSRLSGSADQGEKLAAMGTLLAGIAHELNNPLSVVCAQALLMKDTVTDPALMRRAVKIANAAERCARIVRAFLAMARQRQSERTAVCVNDIVDSVVEVTGHSLRAGNIETTVRLAQDIPLVWANEDELIQVITNLVMNAQQALSNWASPRCVKIVSAYDESRSRVLISVSDNGPGIPTEVQERVFEPFFTTKEVGEGTGIGLAVCHRIVESMAGELSVTSHKGQGAAFTVSLPPAEEVRATPESTEDRSSPVRASKVLLIEKEAEVAAMLKDILASDGHAVRVASSARKALQLLARHEFDLILTDLRMPDMNGFRLFETLCELSPKLRHRIAFITGDSFDPAAAEFLRQADRPYMEKPFSPNQVRTLVREVQSHVRLSELLDRT